MDDVSYVATAEDKPTTKDYIELIVIIVVFGGAIAKALNFF